MPPLDRDLAAALVELGVPQPQRARIVEEIAGDLEELFRELVARGASPDQAAAEAVRLLAPSHAAVGALASVHQPLLASLFGRFSSRMRLAEWLGLSAVTVFALGLAFSALLRADLLRHPSVFLVPLLVIAAAILALSGRKALQLFVSRDHEPARLREGMGSLLMGSGLAVLLSFGGAALEALRLAARLERAPGRTNELLLPWLMDTSVLICTGLTTALIGGFAWFLFHQKIAAVEGEDLRAAHAMRRATSSAAFTHVLHSTEGRP